MNELISWVVIFTLLFESAVAPLAAADQGDGRHLPSTAVQARVNSAALQETSVSFRELILAHPLIGRLVRAQSEPHGLLSPHYFQQGADDSPGPGTTGLPPSPSRESDETHYLDRPGKRALIWANRFKWIPSFREVVIPAIEQYRTLSQERDLRLNQTTRTDYEHLTKEMTGFSNVRIFPNDKPPKEMESFIQSAGYTPLLAVQGDTLYIKEAVYAIPDIRVRNGLLAWSFAYARASSFLIRHPTWQQLLMTATRRWARATHPFDYAAIIWGFLRLDLVRMIRRTRQLKTVPPVTLEQILQTANIRSESSRQFLAFIYAKANTFYKDKVGHDWLHPSGISYFANATATALLVAEAYPRPEVIAAALLCDLTTQEISSLVQHKIGIEQARLWEVQGLTNALQDMMQQPFQPDLAQMGRNQTDYSVQYYTNRFIQVSDQIAHRRGVDFTSLLYASVAARSRAIFTIAPANKEELRRKNLEFQVVYSPLLERLGTSLAPFLRNSYLRNYQPTLYEKIRRIVHDTLNMSPEQVDDELERLSENLCAALPGLGIQLNKVTVKPRRKLYVTIWEKWIEELLEAKARGQKVPLAQGDKLLASQKDLLGLRVIVNTPQELEMLGPILDQLLGTLERPTARLEGSLRKVHLHGRLAYQMTNFQYQNPYADDGSMITAELQIMTREFYRERYVSGQSPMKYQEAHWKVKARRIIHNLTSGIRDLPMWSGQQFDHQDPPLTGDSKKDAEAIRDSLKRWVFPLYTTDPSAMTAERVDAYAWKILKLSAESIMSDIVSHPDAGGRGPDDYPDPYNLGFVADAMNRAVAKVSNRTPVSLTTKLAPDTALVFDYQQPRSYSTAGRTSVFHEASSPWEKVHIVASVFPKPEDRDHLNESGREILGDLFGNLNDESFRRKILGPLLQWQGFRGNENGFYQAIALAQDDSLISPTDREPFKRLESEIKEWYSQRFVQFDFSQSKIITNYLGDKQYYALNITVDEAQIGFLADFTEQLPDYKIETFSVKTLPGNRAQVQLIIPCDEGILKEKAEEGLKHLVRMLKGVHRYRGDRPPPEKGERVKIDLLFSEKAVQERGILHTLARHLSDLDILIESGRLEGLWLELAIVAPSSFKKYPRRTVEEVLQKELSDVPDLVGDFEIKPAALGPATVAELRRILAEVALKEIREEFWNYLPFDPRVELVRKVLIGDQTGEPDEQAVSRFRTFWEKIITVYHPSQDNEWAKEQRRENGAPALVHLLEVTWMYLKLPSPDLNGVLAASAHDLLEYGVMNVVEKAGKAPDLVQNELIKALQANLPSYIAKTVLKIVRELTQKFGQSYAEFIGPIASQGSLNAVIIKLFDEVSNIKYSRTEPGSDRPRRISRAVRFYLDMINLPRYEENPNYDAARNELLATVISRGWDLARLEPYYEKGRLVEAEVLVTREKMPSSIAAFLALLGHMKLHSRMGFNRPQLKAFKSLLLRLNHELTIPVVESTSSGAPKKESRSA
jgi:hypothetical protein